MIDKMDPVDIFYEHIKDVLAVLDKHQEISIRSDLDDNYKKTFILAAASNFEHEIYNILEDLIKKHTDNTMLYSFIKSKAIASQYHTYFIWGEKNNPDNPNKDTDRFLLLFGKNCKKRIRSMIENNNLKDAESAFIKIGHIRNVLVHSNYIENKEVAAKLTTNEVYGLYQEARKYVGFLRKIFIEDDLQCDEK
jgi:hypothetical protein